ILTALIGSGSMDCFGKREKLFNQIPSALKKSEQVAERDQSNIKDLFGGNETVLDLIEDTAIRPESVDLLSAEWNSLGFYLESHPIESRKKEVRKMCGFFISELETETHSQRVAGMLMHLNVRQGRKGRFAFATLDDSSGRLEISIWADIFDRYRSVLKKGQLIVVEGVVEKDNYSSGAEKSSFKMVADRILTFDEARNEYLKHIKISLNPNLVNLEKIANGIKDLSNNEDGSPVLISFFGNKAKADILLSKDYSLYVNDDSITSLFELCGKENVDLVYHSGSHVN
ncbi:MAG: OB-fold nucleic acid binding domain-containing protein, partial [Gammaproteobacteria bacterium]